MSFWKSLFGGSPKPDSAEQKLGEAIEYKGFVIRAAPFQEAGKYMTAGIIEQEVAGARHTHSFIRADSHATFDQAASFSVDKARQIVDLMGEKMFE